MDFIDAKCFKMAGTFLSAEWRKLGMVNYAVDSELLAPYVPAGTELDLWNGTCYISLVGFMFVNTRLLGIPVPFHVNFEEINLRFYVKYKDGENQKRGVVFIKEIVPKPALTWVANTIYKENYITLPTRHIWERKDDCLIVEYGWKKSKWHSIELTSSLHSQTLAEDSEAAFITEHYWGYARVNDRKTSEYQVVHPRWEIYPVKEYSVNVDFGLLYGEAFEFLAKLKPASVFLAEGSEIKVMKGRIIVN